MAPMPSFLDESTPNYLSSYGARSPIRAPHIHTLRNHPFRQDKGEAAAKELSDATGRKCVFASVDVRKPDTLKAAAKKCIEIYGKIDFVICG
jgi:NAD(P)-dependent dehydrogenase (short-subunit alcohol dehydrogenase family)